MNMETTEEWRPIPGWADLYEASSLGRIRSLDRTVRNRGATYAINGRVLRPGCGTSSMRPIVHLFRGGCGQSHYVHALVLSAFKGERPTGMEACHGDGDVSNNAITNLRWDTRSANNFDRYAHGAMPHGERSPSAKLTAAQVLEIRADPRRQRVIAAEYGVVQQQISRIKRGQRWRGGPPDIVALS